MGRNFFLVICLTVMASVLFSGCERIMGENSKIYILESAWLGDFSLWGGVNIPSPWNYKVAVYIYVDGWWNKPTWDEPLTHIAFDGSWNCDIVTGGHDESATQIAAFLVEADYEPPLLAGDQDFPQSLWDDSLDYVIVDR